MNYAINVLDELAAQYVVGTMPLGARTRFARLCVQIPAALAARERWEERLLPLALAIAPVAPSSRVWPAIQARLGGAQPARARAPHRLRRVWQVALAASALLAMVLSSRYTLWHEPSWQPAAVLAQARQPPLWRLERSADGGRIQIVTVGHIDLPASQDYELWVLPVGEGRPVSLGLLPRAGALGRVLSARQSALLRAAGKVAVSVEPKGGSPTGLPTGPVVMVADLLRAA